MTLPAHQPPTTPHPSLTGGVRQALSNVDRTPFSVAGFDMLQKKADEYIDDLVLESVRIMERKQADTVSANYVQQASDNLVASRRRRLFTFAGTLGGVLLGAGVSSYIEMVKAGTATISTVMTASALAVVGTFLVALQFSKE